MARLISEAEVRSVIGRLQDGESISSIAKDMGVSHNAIWSIGTGKAWVEVANDMDYEPKPCFKRKAG